MLLTAASMVACINAIVGGVAVALALRSLLEASVPVSAVVGTLVGLGLAALFFAYQVGASVGRRPWSWSCTRVKAQTCRDGERSGRPARRSSSRGHLELEPAAGVAAEGGGQVVAGGEAQR